MSLPYSVVNILSTRRMALPSTSATGAALLLSTGSPKVRICSAMHARLATACRTTSTSRRRRLRPRRPSPSSSPDTSFTLRTDRGVFSHGRLDTGTALLLRAAPAAAVDGRGARPRLRRRADRRDAGPTVTGAGGVGRRRQRAGPGAVRHERRRATGSTNVVVAAPDDVPADVRFDLIWSNPPIRIGKPALHELLTTWLDRLTPDGRAVLVVHKHLGSDSLHRWLDRPGLADEAPDVGQGLPPPRRASPSLPDPTGADGYVFPELLTADDQFVVVCVNSCGKRSLTRGVGRRRGGCGSPWGGGRRRGPGRGRPSAAARAV